MDNLSDHYRQERFNIRNHIGQVTQSSFKENHWFVLYTDFSPNGRTNTAGTDRLIGIYLLIKKTNSRVKGKKGITQGYQILNP